MRKFSFLVLGLSTGIYLGATPAQANLNYDVGAASGSRNGKSYSEVNIGLNWRFADQFSWRNSVFQRSMEGEPALVGLDTSIRYNWAWFSEAETFGLSFYAGPGYRFSSKNNSAGLIEAGVGARLGGLGIGLGVKSLYYEKSGSDVTYFLTLSGSGTL